MNEVVAEWVEYAEGDYALARRALFHDEPLYAGTCFHAQQCAEKYLKAALTNRLIEFPRTHQLARLLELYLPTEPAFEVLRADLASLENHSVAARYPGARLTTEMAEAALAAAQRVRAFVRQHLALT